MKGVVIINEWQECHIACTILAKDENEKISFLLANEEGLDRLMHTTVPSRTTALAKILEKIRETMYLNVENVELVELTNGIYKNMHIPIYVFSYSVDSNNRLQSLLKDENNYHWVNYKCFLQALSDWEISGVPFFNEA